MKIMMLSGYMYLKDIPGFDKSSSGFGYTVGTITQELAKNNQVYVLTQSNFTDAVDQGNLHILPKRWPNILGAFSFRYLAYWCKDAKGSDSFSAWLRSFFYYMTGKYAEKLLKKIKPDIVNIRGIELQTQPFLYACARTHTPFVLSLHGINRFNPDNGDNKNAPLYVLEKRAAVDAGRGKYPMTVLSGRGKEWILSTAGVAENDFIQVIPNGKAVPAAEFLGDRDQIRAQYGIAEGDVVYICVSTISANKNQIQLIRAFSQMPEPLRKKAWLLLVGDGSAMQEAQTKAKELKIDSRVIFTGRVPQNRVFQYYAAADINTLVSICEGFGNSFAEGFQFGIPSVTFSDLDAIPDIYNEDCVITVPERTDEALSKALALAGRRSWNRETIMRHGELFTVDTMIGRYQAFFEQYLKTLQQETLHD